MSKRHVSKCFDKPAIITDVFLCTRCGQRFRKGSIRLPLIRIDSSVKCSFGLSPLLTSLGLAKATCYRGDSVILILRNQA